MRQQIWTWLEMGVIKPNISRHHHSLVTVKKKEPGYIRICLDVIALTDHTSLFNLKVERIENLCVKFAEVTRGSFLDLVCSYFQLEVSADSHVFVLYFEG